MKTSLKELFFALLAFTLSFSVAYITEIKIVKDAVLISILDSMDIIYSCLYFSN